MSLTASAQLASIGLTENNAERDAMKQVYKITYPTGKIYIGNDSIGSTRYMGSPNRDILNADFMTMPPRKRRDYTVRKQILWESEDASEAELSAKEVEMIRLHRSNDSAVGYNRWPKFLSDNPDSQPANHHLAGR